MTDNPTSLYTAWLDALPQAFRMLVPGDDRRAPAGGQGCIRRCFRAVSRGPGGQGARWGDGAVDPVLRGLPAASRQGRSDGRALPGADRFRHRSRRPIAGDLGRTVDRSARRCRTGQAWRYPAQPWTSLFSGLVPGEQGKPVGANQLQLGIERTFGGLGEAFGLGPMRELQQAWREMLTAGIAKQRSQAEYLAIAVQAWVEGTQGLLQELQAMGARGERVESLLAFIRLWAKAIDGPMHDAMQNARGLASDGQADQCVYAVPPAIAEGDWLGERGLVRADRCRHGQRLPRNPGTQTRIAATQEGTPPAAQKKIMQAREQTA